MQEQQVVDLRSATGCGQIIRFHPMQAGTSVMCCAEGGLWRRTAGPSASSTLTSSSEMCEALFVVRLPRPHCIALAKQQKQQTLQQNLPVQSQHNPAV